MNSDQADGQAGGTWSDERLLAAAAAWAWWPPDTTVHDEPEYLLTLDGADQARNVVQRSSAITSSGDDLIAEVLERVRAAGRAAVGWWVLPTTLPADMGAILERRGFALAEQEDVLAWDLGDGPEPRLPSLDVPAGVSAALVRDAAGLRLVHELGARVFGHPAPSEETLALWTREMEARECAGTRTELSYLAFVDGMPAGSAGTTLTLPVARLWAGGILPEFRGRGAYRALVEARLRDAHARGARYAITKAATGTSSPILRRAGFRYLGRERCYTLSWDAEHGGTA